MDTEDLKEVIRTTVDEVQFLELLDISIEELIDRFEDVIIEKQNHIIHQLELEDNGVSALRDSDSNTDIDS